MNELAKLRKDKLLRLIMLIVTENDVDAYIVGGIIRNIFLSYPPGTDYDLAVSGRTEMIAREFAERFKARAFILDRETSSYRIVKKRDKEPVTVDIAAYKGSDIMEDIESRDFTVNAMAVNLKALFKGNAPLLLDPKNGLDDCRKGVLRPISERVFDDDPLRLLRAIRISAEYGLKIDDDVKRLMQKKVHLLNRVSMERIRDEFFSILLTKNSFMHVDALCRFGILKVIIPETSNWEYQIANDMGKGEGDYREVGTSRRRAGDSLLAHSLKTLMAAESLLAVPESISPAFGNAIREHFEGESGGLKRMAIFLFAAFFHDAGKPHTMEVDDGRVRFYGHDVLGGEIAKRVGKRLKMGKKAIRIFADTIANHHRIFNLSSIKELSQRSKYRFFRSVGDGCGIDLILLAVSDARATTGKEDPLLTKIIGELLHFYYNIYIHKKKKPILSGKEMMKLFGLKEGPLIGRMIERMAKAEEDGQIQTKEDGVKLMREWLSANRVKD